MESKTVQELLGHTSIVTTQRYLTSLAESKQKAMDSIAAKILGGCRMTKEIKNPSTRWASEFLKRDYKE
ncbi:MAG: hypothetical protein HPY51_13620 [Candidatus Omnitrophica bacterium]|nr:hypothetical protein [Candidatus Omnitrophota bacterium]